MPKTLSQRIADRVAKEDKGATKKNRAVFLALRVDVEDALKDGWPVKTIWETLYEEGRVAFSYQAFRLYVNKLIVQDGGVSQVIRSGHTTQVETNTPAAQATAPAAPQAIEPVVPKSAEIPGFNFNTKPQQKDLI